MKIEDLLRKISAKPEMYLGEATLSRFDAFLLGWMLENEDEDTERFIGGFQKWIEHRYRITSSHSWANIIRFYASNDVKALADAFRLFEEYMANTSGSAGLPVTPQKD